MAKSNAETTEKEKAVHHTTNGEHHDQGSQDAQGVGGEYGELIAQARHWVEENQATAMLSGFGFGVFIGVLLRR